MTTTSPAPLQPRHVSLVNILGSVVQGLPELGITLKGVAALVTTKPEKKKSIGLLLEKHAASQPDHIAIRYQNITWSYQQLNEAANRIAHLLISQGIGAGDSVGVMLENRPESLIAVMAIVKLGAVAGMIDRKSTRLNSSHVKIS